MSDSYDAAYLRQVFDQACDEFHDLSQNKKAIPQEKFHELWAKLYWAIQGTQAGLDIQGHIARLEYRLQELEKSSPRPESIKTEFVSLGEGFCQKCRAKMHVEINDQVDKEFVYGVYGKTQ